MRLVHECMGVPASPPVTSEESEVDGDSPPPLRSVTTILQPPVQSQPITISQQLPPPPPQKLPMQLSPQPEQPVFNSQLITIDERTLQLHFTPLYFSKHYVLNFAYLISFF